MKLFISWSGERSKVLALALRDWFPLVLHYVEPWLSEADIEAGSRWADEVAGQLETSNFGIICVTRENMSAPWILFEAGALAKSIQGSRVVPLLLDLDFRDISGPLAQFQAKKIEKDGLLDTVQSINQAAPQGIGEERYKMLFSALWPDLKSKIDAIPSVAGTQRHSRSQAEILEELVTAIRTIESRVRDSSEDPRMVRRKRLIDPKTVYELVHLLGKGPSDPINILVIASMFREDAPWLYELGMEAYRFHASGQTKKFTESKRRFMRAVDMTMHGPAGKHLESSSDARMLMFMARDLLGQVGYEDDADLKVSSGEDNEKA